MNWATGCTICAARGRIPTQTPIGTQMKLASAINMKTRNMVRNARPQTCNASRGEVFAISTATMCHSPSTTAAITSDTQNRSRLRFGCAIACGDSASPRLTARLVHKTAA